MEKVLKKVLEGLIIGVLVVAFLAGMNVTKTVKADENTVPLEKWTFLQGGQYHPNEPGNEGYINSVTMNDTNETIAGWLKGEEGSVNQTQKAVTEATGFAIDIDNTGWDAQWRENPVRINPWSIQALMRDVHTTPGKRYEISFKASATRKKYGYVLFTNNDDYKSLSVLGDDQLIILGPEEKTFKYEIDSHLSSNKLTTIFMLGAFDAQYDFEGKDITNIVTEVEKQWKGTVYISDFKIVEHPPWYVPPKSFIVTFKDGDNIISTQTISSGLAAKAPSLEKEGYTLSWDQSFDCITRSLTINAVWTPKEIETSTNIEETDEITEKEQTTVTKVKVAKAKVFSATKTKSSKKVKISLKKIRRASKYQIQISTSKKFKKVLVKKKVKKISTFISSKKLKKQKKLYVRARALMIKEGHSYYGDWSSAKKVKIK